MFQRLKTNSLSLVAPLYVRCYVERCTARLIASEIADPNFLKKALTSDVVELHGNATAVLKKQTEILKILKEELLAHLKKGSDEVEAEVDTILEESQRKIAVDKTAQILHFMEPAMKDEVRIRVGSYYVFWLFILRSEKLRNDKEVVALKNLMKKNGIEEDEVMAREVSSLWVRTSRFGIYILLLNLKTSH
jgi:hypothetical protein